MIFLILTSCASKREAGKTVDQDLLGKKEKQEWFSQTNTLNNYISHKPDEEDLRTFKSLLKKKHYTFVIYAGYDCSDCHENIPKILKIFDAAGISESDYSIYLLDHKLEEPGGYHKNHDIPTTPSLFIMHDGVEIGMITYPYYNWLEMMIEIIREDLNN
ncbi:MAG: hypothetical protein ACOC4D_00735 [Bacteroidota bacterium]